MLFNYALLDFRRAESNLSLAFDSAFAFETENEQMEKITRRGGLGYKDSMRAMWL